MAYAIQYLELAKKNKSVNALVSTHLAMCHLSTVSQKIAVLNFFKNSKSTTLLRLTRKSVTLSEKESHYIRSMISFSSQAFGRSFLLPRTRTGIPASWGFAKRLCNSFRDASILSWSDASTMYLQQFSHMSSTDQTNQLHVKINLNQFLHQMYTPHTYTTPPYIKYKLQPINYISMLNLSLYCSFLLFH